MKLCFIVTAAPPLKLTRSEERRVGKESIFQWAACGTKKNDSVFESGRSVALAPQERDRFVGFFFSSRRRHTSCLSDWSSDVCSSDLLISTIWRQDRVRDWTSLA